MTQKVTLEVVFNFRFQNTQNKKFSRQTTLVGGSLIPLNKFLVSKSIFETFLSSYCHFFDEMALKIAKFLFDAMSKIFNQKRVKFCFFERHFIKKVHIAAEERLKNTFLHRERVQGYN